MARKDGDSGDDGLNGRMCIVSRKSMPAEHLIRFVAAPDGSVVADLKRRLPGRGANVEARREAVEAAVRRKLFARALKAQVKAGEALGAEVDGLLGRAALGSAGLARKAGQLVSGAAKVDAAIRARRAIAVVHAVDAAPDGIRKMDAARKATEASGRANAIPAFRPFTADEMGLALGGENVIHAAVLAGSAGSAFLKRLEALAVYRGERPIRISGGGQGATHHEIASENSMEPSPEDAPGTDVGCGTDPAQEAEA